MHDDHHPTLSGRRLFITMVLNFLITAVEIVGGIASGSLSLLSDALHNFSDGISVIISWIALRLSSQPRTHAYTFGMKRAQILAAVFNAATLIAISLFLLKEVWGRFHNPQPIRETIMIGVASIGLVANVIGTLLLHRGAGGNMNIRSSYLHLLSDAVSSAAVIAGGIAIHLWGITWVDPLLTLLILIYILKESMEIVWKATGILMMKAPSGLDLEAVRQAVESLPGIKNLHHIHTWNLDENDVHFEAHACVSNTSMEEATKRLESVENLLTTRFGIRHVTIQLEIDRGHDEALL